MLLSQNLSRSHQRDLVPVLDRDNRRFETYNRLARSHIALQQTPHGIRLLHIRGNLLKHTLLGSRRMKRQDFLDRSTNATIQAERDSSLRLLLPAFKLQSQLNKEKLVKNQPDVSWSARRLQVLKALAGFRPMYSPQSLPRRDQPQARAHNSGDRLRQIGIQILKGSPNDAAKPAGGKMSLSSRFVNRHDAANFQ